MPPLTAGTTTNNCYNFSMSEPRLTHIDESGQAIGTPSVRTSLTQDVYLTLIEQEAQP